MACLRNQTLDALMNANVTFPAGSTWHTTIDGIEITKQPLAMLGEVDLDGIESLIAGVNENEGSIFVGEPVNRTEEEWAQYREDVLQGHWYGNLTKEQREEMENLYPLSQGFDSANDFMSDVSFKAPTRAMLNEVAKQNVRVYHYVFNVTTEQMCANIAPKQYCHAAHSSELPFLFNWGGGSPLKKTEPSFVKFVCDQPQTQANGETCTGFTPLSQTIADLMSSEWVAMATQGSPTERWPQYNTTSNFSIVFGESEQSVVDQVYGTTASYRKQYMDWNNKLYRDCVLGEGPCGE